MWLELFGGLDDENGGGDVCPNKELVAVPDWFCAEGWVGFTAMHGRLTWRLYRMEVEVYWREEGSMLKKKIIFCPPNDDGAGEG